MTQKQPENSIACLLHPEMRIGVSECPLAEGEIYPKILIWINHEAGGQRKAVVVRKKKLLELIEKESG